MQRNQHCAMAVFVPVCLFIFALSFAPAYAGNQPDRQVAITIDDLPAGDAQFMSAADITDMTSRLLTALEEEKIPAVGFVNENKVYKRNEVDQRINALGMWLDSGFELGNHTFAHTSLNQAGLKAFEEDIVRGETVTQWLLLEHKMKVRYFRHPYLDVGRDIETRREAEAFLASRGYRIAPVTVDGWDWMYARVYEDAKKRGDTQLQKQLVDSYLSYSDARFAFAEQLSKELVGYEIKQILLLHANELEADHLRELAAVIRKRGYRFITLEDALGDEAYSMPDTFVAEEGTDWLDHWAITRGRPAQGHPVFPDWVIEKDKAIPRPMVPAP
ncbi:MAG TPA: polysaccharide deacetylase family protein [Terriglobales bacterium]|nr:polysaccharide deacetylase family protein [Terriglobales bacterium]